MNTFVTTLTAGFLLGAVAGVSAEERGLLKPEFGEMMGKYCYECHGNSNAEAELNLEVLMETPEALLADPDLMQDLLWMIDDGEMPPVKSDPQPTADERQTLVAALEKDLDYLAGLHQDDPGRVIMPRLTRDEYEKVIRDLSGGVVELDAARFLAAPSRAGEGFTNVGAAQGSTLGDIEGYLDLSREVLNHLRIGPGSGLRWSSVPVEAPEDAATVRKQQILDVLNWHTHLQNRLIGASHQSALEENLDLEHYHAAYLEGAWRYRFRDEFGMPDATFQTVAESFDPPLHAGALERWWKILQKDGHEPIFAVTVDGWRAIPGPQNGGNEIVRQRSDELMVRQRATTSDFTLNEGPPYETSIFEGNPQRSKQTLNHAKEEGWMEFDLDLEGNRHLYFIVTDAMDGGEADIVLWHRGVFHREGETIAWQTLPPAEIVDPATGKKLGTVQWGRDAEGNHLRDEKAWTGPEEDDPDLAASISVQAPVMLRLKVPEGADRFTADLRIHRELGEDSSLQALILRETEELKGDWAINLSEPLPKITASTPPTLFRPWMVRFYPWRHIMGVPGSDKSGTASRDYHRVRLLFQTPKLRLGKNAERAIFAEYDGPGLEHFGGPWKDQDRIKPRTDKPYYYTFAQLREEASPEAMETLHRLYADVPWLGQPAYQELHKLVEKNEVADLPEGRLPSDEIVTQWSQADQRTYHRLLGEIREFEHALITRAEGMVRGFVERAWRRPVKPAEMEELMAAYQQQRIAGATFEQSVKLPLRIVLCSPNFLYRAQESENSDEPYPLDSLEIASRLSFALWSSVPDDELLRLAATDRLRDPEVLRAQARRLLADPRSEAFATEFAGRWFGFSGFEYFAGPDSMAFPEFTPELRRAMYLEAVMFFRHIFQNDRPISDFVDADYTFLNESLAQHYGIEGVQGPQMRQVKLDTPKRGGVLGMGSILTSTSKPLRTSPVNRGVWVVEQVIGQSLPEPPPDVPELSREATDPEGLTVVEQLAAHREQPMCASCHTRIDPFGIALQNFDPVGKWRDVDPAGKPIEAKGALKDGATVDGLAGLKEYLKTERREKIIDTFCRKMVGYLLGRATGPGDARLLDEMKEALKQNDLRFTAALDIVVTSPQFLNRRDVIHQ